MNIQGFWWSQWASGLRRGSVAALLPVLWVRIPPVAWMSVCCECCMLSGRGLCIGLITRPEESYRLWCVWVWSWSLDTEEALAHSGGGAVAPWITIQLCRILHRVYCFFKWLPSFLKIILPSSSGSSSTRLDFDPEDDGSRILRNFDSFLTVPKK